MTNPFANKRRLILLVVLSVAGAFSIAVYTYIRLAVRSENQAAESVVRRALIAVRRNDAKTFERVLYSRTVLYRLALTHPKLSKLHVNGLRRYWGLNEIAEPSILRTVKARRDVDRAMVAKILQENVNDPMTGDWPTWDRDKPVLVMYSVRGVAMVSVALREDGVWKIGGSPLLLSAKVLDYGSITDARVGGDMLAIPPGKSK